MLEFLGSRLFTQNIRQEGFHFLNQLIRDVRNRNVFNIYIFTSQRGLVNSQIEHFPQPQCIATRHIHCIASV